MIKKTLYILPVYLLILIFAGCKDDATLQLPETVPLIVEASGKSFVMGETLTLTIKVNDEKHPDLVTNEDFDVYLTAQDGLKDVSKTLFKEFPSMVTFPKGKSYIQIKLPITDTGIEPKQKVAATITTFVRGYTVTNSAPAIIVSDQHYIIMSIKNNSDKIVKEGAKFVVKAELPIPMPYDMDININVPKEQKKFYETLPPTTLTIKAGDVSGEVTAQTLHNKETKENTNLTLDFTTVSNIYPLDETQMKIILKDIDVAKGDRLQDERWVYDEPDIPFASQNRLTAVQKEYGQGQKIEVLAPHPNPDLAEKGWKFYNAWEFHGVGDDKDLWNLNTYENRIPSFMAARNTLIAQGNVAIINEKFSSITEEGYLRMIQMKVPSVAMAPASGNRDYGTSAFYACGTNTTYKSNSQLILAGSRMEIRARLLGEKNGFNMAIWLISRETADQNTYSEVDILENPVGAATGNKAHQTFHNGPTAENQKSTTTVSSITMTDWNIYWMEWRSEEEIALGINGQETVCLKKSDCTEEEWTFTNAKNIEGLKFILTMGAPNKWALGKDTGTTDATGNWKPDAGWDSGFASFNNYERDRTNSAIPRMEIDWIRTYINTNTVDEYENGAAAGHRNKYSQSLFY